MIERMVAKRWLSGGKNYWYIDWSDDSGFGFGSNLVDVNQKDFLFENTNSLFSDFFLIGFFGSSLTENGISFHSFDQSSI